MSSLGAEYGQCTCIRVMELIRARQVGIKVLGWNYAR